MITRMLRCFFWSRLLCCPSRVRVMNYRITATAKAKLANVSWSKFVRIQSSMLQGSGTHGSRAECTLLGTWQKSSCPVHDSELSGPPRNGFSVHFRLVRLRCVIDDRCVDHSDLPTKSALQWDSEHPSDRTLRWRPTPQSSHSSKTVR